MHAHARPPHTPLASPPPHVHYFSLGRLPTVCVCPRLLLSGTHRSIYLSSQVCLQQTHIYFPSSLLTVHAPICPIRFHAGAHSRPSFHLSHARTLLPPRHGRPLAPPPSHTLSPCLPLRTLFASNTCRRVYELISLHIARSTIIRFHQAPIHLPR